ncbi:MAG: lipase secretion chaperone [Aquabacterium sp.]
MDTRVKLIAGGAALALLAGGGLLWRAGPLPTGAGGARGADGWAMITPGAPADTEVGAPGRVAPLSAEQVRQRLFRQGSLAGTEAAGDWCVSQSQLQPCAGLRHRFEYYILGLGEVTADELRVLVADEVQRAHGPVLAGQIVALWDRYWQLRGHAWRHRFDQNDRSTWLPVFEERRLVRRQILGAEWAAAFYADEETRFQAHYAQLESGLPPPPDPGEPVPQMAPGKDPAAVHAERVARYGEAAAQRLAKADDEWADWQRRLAAARQEWQHLQAAAHLSDAQRRQEMARYVDQHFKSDEHLRVQALLKL